MLPEFKNEPFTDFSKPENAEKMRKALEEVKSEFGKEYPIIIGGERITTGKWIESVDPCSYKDVVGRVAKADRELAEKAMRVALDAFEEWKRVRPEERARYLFKAAKILRDRKFEFSAWTTYEVGKNWAEADGDIAEAIDFMEFYAREMIRLGGPQPLTRIPGADNELYYIPLGVGVVIPPWNFTSIMIGMTVASVVAGNTVILKPSSFAPVVAAKFMEIVEEVGFPPGVINYLPGSGAEIGDYLVAHPKTRFITFTGSAEVGLHINELAAKRQEGQIWIKRVIAEMGGKDFVIVADPADLEEAAKGIVASAYGYSGQKCSAGSRAIVVESVYDEVLDLIVEKTRQLTVGHAAENPSLAAVIHSSAYNNILSYIEVGKKEGKLMVGGGPAEVPNYEGWYIKPTVFADVDPFARIAQEEIFGPVLAVIKAKDFDDAVRIANSTVYGLTGSLYSKNREHIERGRWELHVGNLYFNRKCTGALVGVHPFGGFNLSGTDSKAGGRDYLLLLTQAKSVSEKL